MTDAAFDVIILGGGTGGYVTAIRAAQLGLTVGVVEKDKLGGVCLHKGCIPTKAMIESANVYDLVKRSNEFGVTVNGTVLDFEQVVSRRDQVVAQLHRGVEFLMKKNKVTVIQGTGKIVARDTVSVNQQTYQAKNLIIGTGSRPSVLSGINVDGKRVVSSDEALQLGSVPASVIVVGAGTVGTEFASMWRSFGSEVTIIERKPNLVPLVDSEVSKQLERSFSKRGVKVVTNCEVLPQDVQLQENGVQLTINRGDKSETLQAEKLLLAVGRIGNVEGIGLEQIGVETNNGFIKTDEARRTNVPNVFAIGDVKGGLLLAHVAGSEGIFVVESIAGKQTVTPNYSRVPLCVYSPPEIASFGLTEDAAKEQGINVKVGKFPFRANSKAMILGELDGLAKVVTDQDSGEILGVHLVGPRATELIAEPTLAKLIEATAWEVAVNIHPHPTLSEVIMEAARDVDGWAIHI